MSENPAFERHGAHLQGPVQIWCRVVIISKGKLDLHAYLRGSLNTPIERGLDAMLGGVHFSGPPRFGPLGIFLAKFGFCGPKLLWEAPYEIK